MENHPSNFTGDPLLPVESGSWNEVQQFLQRLNEREGVTHYRLPTEAQWEYACRAGTKTPWYYQPADTIAWYKGTSSRRTHPVGQKLPNVWGLYDMLGNVWEWCHDGMRHYAAIAATDPMGPTGARADRVIRGGSWLNPVRAVRAAYRLESNPGLRTAFLGFRCLRLGGNSSEPTTQ